MARVVNLVKLHDGKEEWYEFQISAGPGDFERALGKLKELVPYGDGSRVWDQERKRWTVRATCAGLLETIFANWEAALDACESQMRMFG